jgi:hypothetical protein
LSLSSHYRTDPVRVKSSENPKFNPLKHQKNRKTLKIVDGVQTLYASKKAESSKLEIIGRKSATPHTKRKGASKAATKAWARL